MLRSFVDVLSSHEYAVVFQSWSDIGYAKKAFELNTLRNKQANFIHINVKWQANIRGIAKKKCDC